MRKRQLALLLLAAGLWLTAVIACRASFSPDGSRVLFPFIDQARKQSAIGLYDLKNGKTELVFSVSSAGKEGGFLLAPQWTSDGQRAIVTSLDGSKRLSVHVLPLETRTPSRLFVLDQEKDQTAALLNPPALAGGRYLFLGGTSVNRLDLETGEVLVSDLKGEIALLGQDEVVYYLRDVEGAGKAREVGKLEHEGAWENLRLAPLATFADEGGELGKFLAVDREGARFALTAEKEGLTGVSIASLREPQRRIVFGSRAEAGMLGNLLWAPDGRRIFVAYAREAPEKKIQFGACEVPLEGGEVRRIPLFSMAIGGAERELYLFQIALSPDGKTLAASSALLDPDKLEPADRALWLIDLGGAERKISRVPLPSPLPGLEKGK
jgi:hypothetical protein